MKMINIFVMNQIIFVNKNVINHNVQENVKKFKVMKKNIIVKYIINVMKNVV